MKIYPGPSDTINQYVRTNKRLHVQYKIYTQTLMDKVTGSRINFLSSYLASLDKTKRKFSGMTNELSNLNFLSFGHLLIIVRQPLPCLRQISVAGNQRAVLRMGEDVQAQEMGGEIEALQNSGGFPFGLAQQKGWQR